VRAEQTGLGLHTIMDRHLAAAFGAKYVHLVVFAIDIDRVYWLDPDRADLPFGWEVFLVEHALLARFDRESAIDRELVAAVVANILEAPPGEPALGGQIDPATLDTPQMREALLQGLIAERLVAAAAVRSRIVVTDDALRSVIASMPAFQRDGKFSAQDFKLLVTAQGLSEEQFVSQLRYDLTTGQLTRAIAQTAIAPRVGRGGHERQSLRQ